MKKSDILAIIIYISIIWIPFYILLMRPAIHVEAPQSLKFIDYLTTIITSSVLVYLFVGFFTNHPSSRERVLRDTYRHLSIPLERSLRQRQHRGAPPLGAHIYRDFIDERAQEVQKRREQKVKEITPLCDPALHKELLARNFVFCIECGRVLRND